MMEEVVLTSCHKKPAESYVLRFNTFSGWAVITIDDDGFFNAQSDWGDFQYRWGHFGKCFKTFLTSINGEYFLRKTSKRDTFNFSESMKKHKKAIIEARKEKRLDREDARHFYENTCYIENYSDSNMFMRDLLEDSDMFEKVYETHENVDLVVEYPHGAHFFIDHVLPAFQAELKKELAHEQDRTPNTTQEFAAVSERSDLCAVADT